MISAMNPLMEGVSGDCSIDDGNIFDNGFDSSESMSHDSYRERAVFLLPDISEVKRKIELVQIDLAVDNITTVAADLSQFIENGFNEIETKSMRSLDRFRRTIKDQVQAELSPANPDDEASDIHKVLRGQIERMRAPKGSDDFIRKDLRGIRESIVEYLTGYISEHLHGARHSVLEAKSKITNQLYTTRESVGAFRKSYDVASRLREEERLKKTVEFHESR
jgi:hypothetical protein